MKINRLLVVMSLALISHHQLQADFHDHIGLQLWSLRATALTKGLPASLDFAKKWGVVELEGALVTPNMTAEQVRAALDARGVPCAPIRTLEQVFASPEGRAAVQVVDDPVHGELQLVANPIRLDGQQLPVREPPPALPT